MWNEKHFQYNVNPFSIFGEIPIPKCGSRNMHLEAEFEKEQLDNSISFK